MDVMEENQVLVMAEKIVKRREEELRKKREEEQRPAQPMLDQLQNIDSTLDLDRLFDAPAVNVLPVPPKKIKKRREERFPPVSFNQFDSTLDLTTLYEPSNAPGNIYQAMPILPQAINSLENIDESVLNDMESTLGLKGSGLLDFNMTYTGEPLVTERGKEKAQKVGEKGESRGKEKAEKGDLGKILLRMGETMEFLCDEVAKYKACSVPIKNGRNNVEKSTPCMGRKRKTSEMQMKERMDILEEEIRNIKNVLASRASSSYELVESLNIITVQWDDIKKELQK